MLNAQPSEDLSRSFIEVALVLKFGPYVFVLRFSLSQRPQPIVDCLNAFRVSVSVGQV
jgi:hypothetical protein